MDPKTLANLDPKLRETYERVMGGASANPGGMNTPAAANGSMPPALSGNPLPTVSATPAAPANGGSVMFDAMPNSNTSPSTDAKTPEAPLAANPTAGAVSNPAPTPPPAPTSPAPAAATNPTPDAGASLMNQPIQPAELASLQTSLTGNPLAENKEPLQLSKPLQPLPSPASINQPAAAAAAAKAPSGTIKVLYFIAAIVFFIVYAVFWLKIFHYPLPF